MASRKKPAWTLEGFDTFSSEWYPLPGRFHTRGQAGAAARKRLQQLEKSQPSSDSGGQEGIQDRVYIVSPDGVKTRFTG